MDRSHQWCQRLWPLAKVTCSRSKEIWEAIYALLPQKFTTRAAFCSKIPLLTDLKLSSRYPSASYGPDSCRCNLWSFRWLSTLQCYSPRFKQHTQFQHLLCCACSSWLRLLNFSLLLIQTNSHRAVVLSNPWPFLQVQWQPFSWQLFDLFTVFWVCLQVLRAL